MIDVTPFLETLPENRPVYVYGLGLSGLATVKAVCAAAQNRACKCLAWDESEEARAQAEADGAEIVDPDDLDFATLACLILAPGIPLHYPEPHPVVRKAQKAEIEIIGDLEILHRSALGWRTIGITGTNGKSTTTALVGHILKECGVPAAIGGNIGFPALGLELPKRKKGQEGWIVLEISSFQMDLCPTFTPDVAVITNITPDHIDRHGSLEEYIQAKSRIGDGAGHAVLGVDDEPTIKIAEHLKDAENRTVIPVSVGKKQTPGVWVENHTLIDDMRPGEEPREIGDLGLRALPGAHNHQNTALAYAVCRLAGRDGGEIYEAVKTFPGLAHRQQLVRTINGVAYINDSKATNGDAAARALACYRNLYWIVGGRPKAGGLDGLEAHLERVRHVFLIGEAMEPFGTWLDNFGVPHNFSQTLEHAVLEAHVMAQNDRGRPGGTGTVLLSPACASYDQFKSFEDRGNQFISYVNNLAADLPDDPGDASGGAAS